MQLSVEGNESVYYHYCYVLYARLRAYVKINKKKERKKKKNTFAEKQINGGSTHTRLTSAPIRPHESKRYASEHRDDDKDGDVV